MKRKDMKERSHFKIGSMVGGTNLYYPDHDKVIDMKIEYDQAYNPHGYNRKDAVGCFVYIKLENDRPRAWRNARDFWNIKDE